MIYFSIFNPIAILIFYCCVVIPGLFTFNPITALISFFGSILFRAAIRLKISAKEIFFEILLFVSVALANPLFSHNGNTVLFMMNDNPITAEAVFYGIIMAVMLISVYGWMKTFSLLMTADKLLYAFGRVSPKAALFFSMSLRMLPLLSLQGKKTENAQKAMGLYSDKDIFSLIKSKIKVLSVLITWAIENAIVTADSMAARGYSGEKRTSYSTFAFRIKDTVFTCVCLILTFPLIFSEATSKVKFAFYPSIIFPELTPLTVLSYAAFALLCFIPTLTEAGDKLKWKYFLSKI